MADRRSAGPSRFSQRCSGSVSHGERPPRPREPRETSRPRQPPRCPGGVWQARVRLASRRSAGSAWFSGRFSHEAGDGEQCSRLREWEASSPRPPPRRPGPGKSEQILDQEHGRSGPWPLPSWDRKRCPQEPRGTPCQRKLRCPRKPLRLCPEDKPSGLGEWPWPQLLSGSWDQPSGPQSQASWRWLCLQDQPSGLGEWPWPEVLSGPGPGLFGPEKLPTPVREAGTRATG